MNRPRRRCLARVDIRGREAGLTIDPPLEQGCHVILDLGDTNRYGWRLAMLLQRLHPASTIEVHGAAREVVRLEAVALLVAAGKTITAVEGLDPAVLSQISLERPPSRASKGDTRWERK